MQFEYGPGGFNIEIEKLVLHPDSVVGLVGTTGSGKSTLAFLLAGLLRPDGGSVILGGRRVGDYSARELRQMVGLSWQIADLALIGPTIEDDVRFGLENHAIDVQGILESVGLGGFEHRIVDTLSGGEKRKLSLANLLALQPGLLILDEPSAFLDPDSQAELIGIIRNIARKGNAIVIIGHDLRFISELADRILGMRGGRICLDVPARRFFSNPGLLESLGLPPDPIVVFRKLLGEQGVELPEGTLNPEKIAGQLRTAGPN